MEPEVTEKQKDEAVFKALFDMPIPESECIRCPLDNLPNEDVWVPNDLLASIKRVGVREPVHIIRPKKKNGDYVIVSGHRRVAASKKAELEMIPACIYDSLDDGMAAVFALESNALRSVNVVDDLEKIELLYDKGFSPSMITKATGLSPATISKRMGLLNLIPYLMEQLKKGQLSTSVAEAAAKLPSSKQEELVTIHLDTGKLKLKDVKGVMQVQREAAMESLDDDFFASPEMAKGSVFDDLIEAAIKVRDYYQDFPDMFVGEFGAALKTLAEAAENFSPRELTNSVT